MFFLRTEIFCTAIDLICCYEIGDLRLHTASAVLNCVNDCTSIKQHIVLDKGGGGYF